MNGNKILLDTNIALYFLSGDSTLAYILDGKEVYISIITEMEMLGYPNITDVETAKIKAFISDCYLIDISNQVKERAISIRKQYNLKLPDAIIAASAFENQIPLISADTIFNRINELHFIEYSI